MASAAGQEHNDAAPGSVTDVDARSSSLEPSHQAQKLTTTDRRQTAQTRQAKFVTNVRIAAVTPDLLLKLRVTWSDGTLTECHRSYKEIFTFQCRVLDLFPEEAGKFQEVGIQRIIPRLPGKSVVGKTFDSLQQAVPQLQTYLNDFFDMPSEIIKHKAVKSMFSKNQHDLKLEDLQRTLALEKRDDGTMPEPFGSHLVKQPSLAETRDGFICVATALRDCEGAASELDANNVSSFFVRDRLPFRTGDKVYILRTNDCPAGFWFCRLDTGDEGYAQASDLQIDPGSLKARSSEIVSTSCRESLI